MSSEEVIRKVMEVRGKRFIEVAEELGIARNTLAGRMKSGNISIEKLGEILEVLGYKIVVIPKEHKTIEYEYEIEW